MTGLFDLTDLSGVQPTGSSARMNISSAVNIAIDIVNNCECAATSLMNTNSNRRLPANTTAGC